MFKLREYISQNFIFVSISFVKYLSFNILIIFLAASCGFKTPPIAVIKKIQESEKALSSYYVKDDLIIDLPKLKNFKYLELLKLVEPEADCTEDCFLKEVFLKRLNNLNSNEKNDSDFSQFSNIQFKQNKIELLNFNPDKVFEIVAKTIDSKDDIVQQFKILLPPKPTFKAPVIILAEKITTVDEDSENKKFFLKIQWQKPISFVNENLFFKKDLKLVEYNIDIVIVENLANNTFLRADAKLEGLTFETYEDVNIGDFCAFFIDVYQSRSGCSNSFP